MKRRCVVMIGPSTQSHGGIASVVTAWQKAGVFERWPVMYLATHVEGGKLRKLAQAIATLTQFVVLITAGRVACLHAHAARQNSFWRKAVFMALARLAGIPVILHLHSGHFVKFYAEQCSALGRWLVRHFLDRADRIVVLSRHWDGILASMTTNRRLTVIPNFVTIPSPIPTERQGNGMTERETYVLFLGQLTAEKGFFDLLHAVTEVRQTCPWLRLKCGGDGDRDAAERAIAELALDGAVELLGWVSGEQKDSLLRGAATFILPSYQEGVPMSVLEAMAFGVPVIASAVGGIPDVVEDGTNGYLIEPGNTSAIARAITRLVNDGELRARMARNAAITVHASFSPQAILPRLDSLYRELGLEPQPEPLV